MSDWSISAPLTLFAPAKVNLGLEICGRRSDGYHEIVTLMETISIFDRIDIQPAPSRAVLSDAQIIPETDLINRAMDALEHHTGLNLCLDVTAQKSIPVSAGLGGGSSDAGTLIGALGHLIGLSEGDVHQVAATIGSDVPFFVGGGMALATGTGTIIEPVKTDSRRWYLIVLPGLDIPGKTARLYSQLNESDFSDGEKTRQMAIDAGILGNPMINAFQRPLTAYGPVREALEALERSGSRVCIPSGAGPSVFATFDSYQELSAAMSTLECPAGARTYLATSVKPDLNRARVEAVSPAR
jgi:4-diphosphocytidyl-2-C-methyl-D-erythritol kinase